MLLGRVTENQRKAIFHDKGNLIISASAGAGKTSVVIKRMLRLIIDKNVSVDKILAVTFTKLAAQEMKERLKKGLYKEYYETGDVRIKEQIENVNNADICTIHSFCSNLIKKYFYVLGLDASFEMLDQKKSAVLKSSAIKQLFDELYIEGDPDFLLLVEIFSKRRNDKGLADIILGIYSHIEQEDDIAVLRQKSLNLQDVARSQLASSIYISLHEHLNYYKNVFNNYVTLFNEDTKRCDFAKKLVLLCEEMLTANSAEKLFEIYLREKLSTPSSAIVQKDATELFKKDYAKFKEEFDGGYYAFSSDVGEDIKSSKAIINRLCDLTEKFSQKYNQLKAEENGVDFNDLQTYALKLLENNEVLTAEKNRYEYIFVDEYQDVNAVQDKLISTLEKDNVFMVGDSKQSIYAFRGCDPKYFIEKYEKYSRGEGGVAISLDENFRSSKSVIDSVNNVFTEVMNKDFYGFNYADNKMIYGGGYGDYEGVSQIHTFIKEPAFVSKTEGVYSVIEKARELKAQDYGTEIYKIIDFIKSKVGGLYYDKDAKGENGEELQDKDKYKRITYGDIVILLRSIKGFGVSLQTALSEHGIPVSFSGEIEIAKFPEVKAIVSAVSLLCLAHQDVPLASFMLNFGGFDENELSQIKINNKKDGDFYSAVTSYQNEQGELAVKVKEFLTWLDELRLISSYKSAIEVLNEIITKSNYKSRLLATPMGDKKVQRVERFLSESIVGGRQMKISEFEAYLQTSLEDISITETSGSNTVKILTQHASKGLEFPVVIIAGISGGFSSADLKEDVVYDREFGIVPKTYNLTNMTVSDNPALRLVKSFYDKKRAIEESRLFYVALTRAKCELHVFLEDKKANSKRTLERLNVAKGIFDFISLCDMDYNGISEDIETIKQRLLYNKSVCENHGESEQILTDLKVAIENNLQEYKYKSNVELPVKMSVSNANRHEDEYYKTTAVFGTSDSATGSAYHKYLEHSAFDKDSVDSEYASLCQNGTLTKDEQKLLSKDKIKKILSMPIFEKIRSCKTYKEQKFCYLAPADEVISYEGNGEKILIQGVIDLICETEEGVYLIDYKLSQIESESDIVKAYKKQMQLYKNAIEKALGKKVIKTYLINILQEKVIEV